MTIRTRPANDAYREGWDRTFASEVVQVECTFPDGTKDTRHWPECPPLLKEIIHRAGGTLRIKWPPWLGAKP